VVTKRDEHGVAVSSVSAPSVQATMLEQAALRPGMNVLEIGSGGYNAALLAEMVGPDGSVTTVDIDPYVTERAGSLLAAAGYPQVNVVLADAENGVPEHAPYDRLLVTVGAWDIPPAWIHQLTEDGRIVVPLRVRGLTRSLALDRDGDRLVSRSAELCGFVRMRGAGAHQERLLLLRGEDIALRFDDDGWPADPHALDGVLATDRAEAWSGVTIGRMESFDSLQLWLATSLRGFCLLAADREHDDGLVDRDNRWLNLAAVEHDSFAYVVSRPVESDSFEFGAHAFGPRGSAMVDELVQLVRAWDERRYGQGPTFTVWPKETPDEAMPSGLVIDKRHSRITVAWPAAATGNTSWNKESNHDA
jgi:protein-L-isoaspartate(D-aspartate) O-methyltransferase